VRTKFITIILAAAVAGAIGYAVGHRTGAESSVKREREGQLVLALRLYQTAQATNWAKVQSTLGIQVLGITRDYERRFGLPAGTNSFARHFTEAKSVADAVERTLVPVGSAFTNLPLAPDFKAAAGKEH
jgi:hypothetical protein